MVQMVILFPRRLSWERHGPWIVVKQSKQTRLLPQAGTDGGRPIGPHQTGVARASSRESLVFIYMFPCSCSLCQLTNILCQLPRSHVRTSMRAGVQANHNTGRLAVIPVLIANTTETQIRACCKISQGYQPPMWKLWGWTLWYNALQIKLIEFIPW